MKKLVNGIFVLLGFLFMGLGVAGAVLPLLPTVPFLIAAAFCFAKGSKRFHVWFKETKVYKDNLQTFVEQRSMTRKKKFRALGLMTVMVAFAAWIIPLWQVRVMILFIVLFNYWFFAVCIRTISDDEEKQIQEAAVLGKEGKIDGEQ